MQATASTFLSLLLASAAYSKAQDADTTDSAIESGPTDTAPAPVTPKMTWIGANPILIPLSFQPNLMVEHSFDSTWSVEASGGWALWGINRQWHLALRHHFHPGIFGAFVGIFARGQELETDIDLPESGSSHSYRFRQEGVTIGLQGGRTRIFPNGFSLGWNLGLGYPILWQEWIGDRPASDASAIETTFKAFSWLDGGFHLGYAF